MDMKSPLMSAYSQSGYACVPGIIGKLGEWIEMKGWASPLIVCDAPSPLITLEYVRSSQVAPALKSSPCDVIIIFGDEITTDRVKGTLRDIYHEKKGLPFETVIIPTTYCAVRSVSGRYLDEKGIYHFSSYLVPSLLVIDEEILRNRESLAASLEAVSLMVHIFDMFTSTVSGSCQRHLLEEAYTIFSRHAYDALYSRGAAASRELLAIASYLTATAQNISPPGIIDACSRAVVNHSDLNAAESASLAFPYLGPAVCQVQTSMEEKRAEKMMEEMLLLRENLLSAHTSHIPKTLHAVSRPPFSRGTISLTELAAIADDVYNSIETAVSMPDIDHQSIISWVESIYWGYEST